MSIAYLMEEEQLAVVEEAEAIVALERSDEYADAVADLKSVGGDLPATIRTLKHLAAVFRDRRVSRDVLDGRFQGEARQVEADRVRAESVLDDIDIAMDMLDAERHPDAAAARAFLRVGDHHARSPRQALDALLRLRQLLPACPVPLSELYVEPDLLADIDDIAAGLAGNRSERIAFRHARIVYTRRVHAALDAIGVELEKLAVFNRRFQKDNQGELPAGMEMETLHAARGRAGGSRPAEPEPVPPGLVVPGLPAPGPAPIDPTK